MTPELRARMKASNTWPERSCFVCQQPIPEADGVAHIGFRIVTHNGACSQRVNAEARTYEDSPRGRWRPRNEVLARVAATGLDGPLKPYAGERIV